MGELMELISITAFMLSFSLIFINFEERPLIDECDVKDVRTPLLKLL